ncbi:hypothetical protein CGCF413_v003930 [Colletotrichum fructicola]|nr:hypothetical protein CGCF413_v003930 [Colletotrichum fructicola]
MPHAFRDKPARVALTGTRLPAIVAVKRQPHQCQHQHQQHQQHQQHPTAQHSAANLTRQLDKRKKLDFAVVPPSPTSLIARLFFFPFPSYC